MKLNRAGVSLNTFTFWKKFSHFLFVGIMAMFLLMVGQQVALSNIGVLADDANPPTITPPNVNPPTISPPAQCDCEYSDLASYSGHSECTSGQAVYSGTRDSAGVCKYNSGCSTFLRCIDAPPAPPACNLKNETYGQCGSDIAPGACVGAPFPANHNIEVTRVVDFNTCTAVYSCKDKGEQPGICGVPTTPTPPQQVVCNDGEVSLSASPNSVNVGQTINFTISGDASTFVGDTFSGGVTNCSGAWNSKTCTASAAGNNFVWTHSWKHCVGSTDNCSGVCTKTANFSVTGTNPPPSAPPSTPPGCTSNGSCSAPAPACGSVTTGVDNCGNPCSRQGAACTVTPPGGGINITNTNNNTNSNTNTITFGNVGVGTATQVAGVTSLPKTGLPALAWSALAFLPTGFTLKKFRKVKKTLEDDPNYIWEDRKFKSGL